MFIFFSHGIYLSSRWELFVFKTDYCKKSQIEGSLGQRTKAFLCWCYSVLHTWRTAFYLCCSKWHIFIIRIQNKFVRKKKKKHDFEYSWLRSWCLAHNLLALHFAEGKGALLLCCCVSVVTGWISSFQGNFPIWLLYGMFMLEF